MKYACTLLFISQKIAFGQHLINEMDNNSVFMCANEERLQGQNQPNFKLSGYENVTPVGQDIVSIVTPHIKHAIPNSMQY